MYSPKIGPDLVSWLYRIRESLKTVGEKTTMVALTEQALLEYLPKKEKEILDKDGCLLLMGEPLPNEHEKAITRS